MSTGFKTATVQSGQVPSTQTNFPVYVDLSALGITTLADAQSVRVYSDSSKTTELAREIVSASEMHVLVPSLTTTFTIYVSWNGTDSDYAVTATYGRNAVWSNYKAVWHMDAASTVLVDSTGNTSLAKEGYPTLGAAAIGNGIHFNGSSTAYDTNTQNVIGTSVAAFTFQYWMKQDSVLAKNIVTFQSPDNTSAYSLFSQTTTTSAMRFAFRNNAGALVYFDTAGTFSIGSFYQFHHTYDGSTMRTYMDGVVDVNTASQTGVYNGGATDWTIIAANRRNGSIKDGPLLEVFNGYLDEIRVLTNTLSADWITTEYNNQSSPSTFWGTWTNASGGGTTTYNALGFGFGL